MTGFCRHIQHSGCETWNCRLFVSRLISDNLLPNLLKIFVFILFTFYNKLLASDNLIWHILYIRIYIKYTICCYAIKHSFGFGSVCGRYVSAQILSAYRSCFYCCSHCLKANPSFSGSSGKLHSCGVAQARVIDGVALVTACDRHTAHALPCPQLWQMTNPRAHGQHYQLSSHGTLSIWILNKHFVRGSRRMFWFL
jgi:hypothetical protein